MAAESRHFQRGAFVKSWNLRAGIAFPRLFTAGMRHLFSCLAVLVFPLTISAAPVEVIPAEMRGAAAQPQISVASNGRVHVIFGSGKAIFHASSSDGKSFSAPVKVGELDKLALGLRRGPRIVATGDKLAVTAISHTDGNLHCWTSTDAGKTWREGPPLNAVPGSAREGLHSLAGDGRGRVAVVWLDFRDTGKGVRGRFSADGGATWGEDTLVYQSPDGHVCECCLPNVTVSPDGEIVAMWRNWLGGSRDLYLSSSRDGGRTFSTAQKLGTGTWKLNACPMDGGSVVSPKAGDWLAVWRREGTVFTSTPDAPERKLAENSKQPVAAYAGKTPLLMWENGGALMLQRGEESPRRFAEKAAWASIADAGGKAAVAWESGSGAGRTILFDEIR
jgi:hypothetical protein